MSPVYDSSLMGGSSRSSSRHDGSILPSSSSITTPSRTHDANDRDDVITRELKRLRSDLNDLHPDACAAAATAVDAAAIVLPGDYYCAPTPNDNVNDINAPLLTSDVSTILSKIQEITKHEYTIIVHQRDEICRLRSELHLLQQKKQQQQQQQQHDDRFSEKMIGSSSNKSEAPTSQLVVQSAFSFSDSITMESTHSDGTTSSRSNGSSKSSSSSSSSSPPSFSSYDEFSANEGSAISERNTPYTLTTTTTTNDAQQLLSTSHSLLSQSTIANSTVELRTINESKGEAIAHLEELTCNIQRATANLDRLTITNERLQVEVQTKQNINAKLEKERNKLMGELEIYNDQIELHTLLTHARNANVSLASKVEELQLRLMKEKEKNGMLLLQQGEDATTVLMMGERDEGGDDDDYDIHDDDINHDDNNNEERDDIEEQRGGSNNDDEFGRERSFTGGSDTVSALHDADTISILFDQDLTMIQQQQVSLTTASSIKSDHDSIRLHAEKMLYWANRAEERSAKKKMKSSSSSVASLAESSSTVDRNTTTTLNNGSDVDPDGNTGATKPTTTLSVASSTTATMIPMTIGLPPRSQSRVHRSSRSLLLPPRCPTPPNMSVASSSSITTTGTTTNPTLSPQGSSSTMSCTSDKENGNDMGVSGGNGGFVSGAFPKFARRSRSSHVRMTEIPVTIGHPDDVDENANFVVHRQHQQQQQNQQMVCECKASPFSGNDAQSEFYLPKLGLACNCGYDVDIDRVNFSKDPTSLTNVLRKWQCDFLSSLGVHTANELLNAHKGDANGMARKMKEWRSKNRNSNMRAGSSGGNNDSSCGGGGGGVVGGGGVGTRSRECYVALKIWSRTCKVVLRSIREQKHRARLVAAAEGGTDSEYDSDGVIIEKPHFLDISFADGTNTITSISTLGQFSSVCGGRSFEMMEI